jgi:hypothetical protein
MKIGWGNRILILYLGFVTLIISLVVVSFRQDINLVRADYYEAEKGYNDKYIAAKNLEALGKNVGFEFTSSGLEVSIPTSEKGLIHGSIQFFRPSAPNMDFTDSFKISSEEPLRYPISRFQSGKYLVWLKWTIDNKPFYAEKELFVP